MHIGIDLDGVLADLVGETVKLFNQTWPDKRVDFNEIDGWDYLVKRGVISFKVQSELFYQVWKDFERLATVEKVTVIQESISKLREDGHIVSIITHRDIRTHSYVPRWLSQKKIEHDNLMFLTTKMKLEKHDFVDVLVDDHPRTIEIANQYPNTYVLLRDQPWNRSSDLASNLPNTSRLFSLKDLPGYISSIEERKRSINAF